MVVCVRKGIVFALALIISAAGTAWGQGSPNPKLVEAAKKEGEVVYIKAWIRPRIDLFVERHKLRWFSGDVNKFRLAVVA